MKGKEWIIVSVLVVGLIVAVVLLSGRRSKAVDIKEIKSFAFGYTCGNTIYANVRYSLTLENGEYVATMKPAHVPEEEMLTFVVTKDFVEELEAFLVENEVGKWNGFDKSNTNVMDGDGFELYINTQDGTSLRAHGYMATPKNYSVVADGIAAIFEKLKE